MVASNTFSNKLRSHPFVFLAAVVVAGIMISPFITPIILSVITAYVLRPIVKRLEVQTRSHHIALGILVIIIGLPIILAVLYISSTAEQFFQDIAGLGDKINAVISAVSIATAGIGSGTYAGYFLGAQDMTSRIIEFMISFASDFVISIPFLVLSLVVYLYATYHFMSNGHKIIEFIEAYASTLSAEDGRFLSSIQRGLTRSFDVLFFSYITMSLIVAAFSFIGYSVFGAPHAFLLAILTGLFSFLPIFGAWMVYIPVAAYMYFTENIFAAAGIMIFGVVVLTIFIPFIFYSYLFSNKTNLSAFTVLICFFSGPIIFGAKGLLLGPILFVLAETIIVEYMRYRISGHENVITEAQSQ